jgi:uncharacterized membrane protein YjdF
VFTRIVQLLVVAAAITVAVVRFVAIDSASHSASDTLRPWALETIPVALVAGVLVLASERYARRGPR